MNHPIPTAEEQLRFLQKIQRLLEEGSFNSTYKYALLIALADLCVEKGQESGEPLLLTTREIAEKFVQLYWRQVIPFPAQDGKTEILFQNTDRQAAVINRILKIHGKLGNNVARLKSNSKEYKRLLNDVSRIVREMPLWKLQRAGSQVDDFLYEDIGSGTNIELRFGVSYCFREFHGQILNMVQGAWIRWIRRLQKNQPILGQTTELGDFLFGKDRATLSVFVPILKEVQHGNCFYCDRAIRAQGEVDHFIPWSRYPVDLGHNFVLAHKSCNGSKGDLLAAIPHLENWVKRNERYEKALGAFFVDQNISYDLETSISIGRWSYNHAQSIGAHLWLKERVLLPADRSWVGILT